MIGSSIPNLMRNASRTSGGMFGLLASSPNGSPGASASKTNRMRLMPSRLGKATMRRLRREFPIASLRYGADHTGQFGASGLAIPACDLPEIVVPAALVRDHA